MRTLITVVVLLGTSILQAADPGYQIVKEIAIGGEGGWDYVIGDAAAHRVYVSHATRIVVADADTGHVCDRVERSGRQDARCDAEVTRSRS